jgi:predicted DNA binding CopG/RHH family protein
MSKWWKKEDNNDVDLVKEAFGYSQKKAEVALSLLSPENLKDIKRRLNKGGLKK